MRRNIRWDSESLETRYLGVLLKMKMNGKLCIAKSKHVDDLQFLTYNYMIEELLKDEGFTLWYDVVSKTVHKVPLFEGNEEFIKKYNLYLAPNIPSYVMYEEHMAFRIKKYNEIYDAYRIQKRVKQKESTRRNK